MRALDVLPGDVIDWPWGSKERWLVVVHSVHHYPEGGASVRYRPLSNPRAVDWGGFMEADDPDARLVSRGVCRVDEHVRTLLPA